MVSSVAGLLATPLFGPYAASKFALEAFTDVLRRELLGTGVWVVAVEPGAVATPIWDKGHADGEGRLERAGEGQMQRYAGMVEAVRRLAVQAAQRGLPPDAVGAVVVRAFTARRPRTRYLVGRDARLEAGLAWMFPGRVVDAALRRFLT